MTKQLPTIKIRGKEYFIDKRLNELRSKILPHETIEFLPFFQLTEDEEFEVLSILHQQKEIV